VGPQLRQHEGDRRGADQQAEQVIADRDTEQQRDEQQARKRAVPAQHASGAAASTPPRS
jgi:hypothetical protein